MLELLDEETVDKFDLGELVSRPPNALPNSSKIFVVTAKDILNLNARNVGDALRFVPGLIFSEGGTKNPKLASLPGLGTRQYVVFINNRPVYNPYFGNVDLNNLPIDIENAKDCTWGKPRLTESATTCIDQSPSLDQPFLTQDLRPPLRTRIFFDTISKKRIQFHTKT